MYEGSVDLWKPGEEKRRGWKEKGIFFVLYWSYLRKGGFGSGAVGATVAPRPENRGQNGKWRDVFGQEERRRGRLGRVGGFSEGEGIYCLGVLIS